MPTSELLEKPKIDVPPVWPPDDDGGGGGGGGEPEDAGSGRSFFRMSMGRLGVFIVMLSVGMIFFAFLATWVLMRLGSNGSSPPPPALSMPLLTLSTLLIVLSGIAASLAVRAERRGDGRWVWGVVLAFVTGLGFCASQAASWRGALQAGASFGGDAYAQSFFGITALHLAHVIGGLVYLAVVMLRGLSRRSGPGMRDALINCTLYWHFVGALWIVLLGVLLIF